MIDYKIYELDSIDKIVLKCSSFNDEIITLRDFIRGNFIDSEDIKVKHISYLDFNEDIGQHFTEDTAYIKKYELYKNQGKGGTKIKEGALIMAYKVNIIGIIDNFGKEIKLEQNDKIYFNVYDKFSGIVNMNITNKELSKLKIVE